MYSDTDRSGRHAVVNLNCDTTKATPEQKISSAFDNSANTMSVTLDINAVKACMYIFRPLWKNDWKA